PPGSHKCDQDRGRRKEGRPPTREQRRKCKGERGRRHASETGQPAPARGQRRKRKGERGRCHASETGQPAAERAGAYASARSPTVPPVHARIPHPAFVPRGSGGRTLV